MAAILYGDITVVHSTWKYFLWTLPFWIVFLFESKEFRPDIFDNALSLALIAIFLSTIPQLNAQYRVVGYFGKTTLLGTELAIIVPVMIIITVYKYKQKNLMGRVMLIIPTLLGVYTLLMKYTIGAIIGVLIGGILLAALLYSTAVYSF